MIHLQFLAGWQQADRERRVPILWLTYEELMRDKPAAVARVLAFHGLGAPEEKITAALAAQESDPRRNRFNAGLSGRGQSALTPAQHARLRHLAAAYPAAGFTSFGLA